MSAGRMGLSGAKTVDSLERADWALRDIQRKTVLFAVVRAVKLLRRFETLESAVSGNITHRLQQFLLLCVIHR